MDMLSQRLRDESLRSHCLRERHQRYQQQLQIARYTQALLANILQQTRFRIRYNVEAPLWFRHTISNFVPPQDLKAHIPRRCWLPVRGGAGFGTLFECLMEPTPEATVLHADGELDLSTLEKLRTAAAEAFAERRPVIIDLSGLVYVDGSGFRVLEDLNKISQLRKQPLVLAGPSPWVMKLMQLIHLDGAFPIFSTLSAALDWCRSASTSDGPMKSS